MKRKRLTIVLLVASSLATAALAGIAGTAAASSPASARYGVVNATVNAASDHEIGASTAFPNYTTGAVDNYYSLAHSHIDNSPFAEGTASPADTGPIGQTAAAGNFQQPQYADARWPGKDSGKATFGNPGSPSAEADAGNYKATALSSEASDAGAPGAGTLRIAGPKGFDRRLRLALTAWKARWLAPLKLKLPKLRTLASLPLPSTPTLPGVTLPAAPGSSTPPSSTSSSTTSSTTTTSSKSPSGPPANGALVSSSLAELDPKSAAVVTQGESSLGTVNLGGGQIILKGIDVTVAITNTGRPKGTVSVNIAAASIGGVPVTIDQNGVHVNGQGGALPYGQADDALNAALKQAGIQLYTVVPQVKKSANELEITASGVHVVFAQPVDQSGVPSQTVEHIVGEVYADSLAAPAGPTPKLNLSSGTAAGAGAATGGTSIGGGTSGGIAGGGTSTGYSSSPGAATTGGTTQQATPTSFTTALSKPLWLLVAYLVWQALMIATGASLWRWRAGGVA